METTSSAAKLLGGTRLVDCTHTIDPQTFTYIGCQPGTKELTFDIHWKQQQKLGWHDTKFNQYTVADTRADPTKSGFKKSLYVMACDVGTHIDSPAHWFADARGVDQLTVEELTAPGAVIDATAQASEHADYALTVKDIKAWEEKFGRIPDKALVVMKTGWCKKFENHAAYLGLDENNGNHFPGFSGEAALFLLKERSIVGLGIDTASLDIGPSADYPVHETILGANHYQVENMKLADVPEGQNVTFISLPLKVKDGPESETRVMCVVNEAK